MKRSIAIILFVLTVLAATPAYAAEGMEITASIPIENLAEPGWFALLDGNEIVDEVFLRRGESGLLRVTLDMPDEFIYTIRQIGAENGSALPAEQVYTVHIITYLEDELPLWTSYAVKNGEPGKIEKISFYRVELLPARWKPPQTGDGSLFAYAALGAGALAFILGWGIARIRRRKRKD